MVATRKRPQHQQPGRLRRRRQPVSSGDGTSGRPLVVDGAVVAEAVSYVDELVWCEGVLLDRRLSDGLFVFGSQQRGSAAISVQWVSFGPSRGQSALTVRGEAFGCAGRRPDREVDVVAER
jgi:hypothetical protein